jgi:hypothetical protein
MRDFLIDESSQNSIGKMYDASVFNFIFPAFKDLKSAVTKIKSESLSLKNRAVVSCESKGSLLSQAEALQTIANCMTIFESKTLPVAIKDEDLKKCSNAISSLSEILKNPEQFPIFSVARGQLQLVLAKVIGSKIFESQKHIALGFSDDLAIGQKNGGNPCGINFNAWLSTSLMGKNHNWGEIFSERIKYVKDNNGSIVFIGLTLKFYEENKLLEAYKRYKDACKNTSDVSTRFETFKNEYNNDANKGKGVMTMFELMYLLNDADAPQFQMNASHEVADAVLKLDSAPGEGKELLALFCKRTDPSWPPSPPSTSSSSSSSNNQKPNNQKPKSSSSSPLGNNNIDFDVWG